MWNKQTDWGKKLEKMKTDQWIFKSLVYRKVAFQKSGKLLMKWYWNNWLSIWKKRKLFLYS